MRTNKAEQIWARSRGQFRGGNYSAIDINHIYESHHPYGIIAKNANCRKSLFPISMSKKDIELCIYRAWKYRNKIKTQQARIFFIGFDKCTRITVEIWFNKDTKIIETAYPVSPNQVKY